MRQRTSLLKFNIDSVIAIVFFISALIPYISSKGRGDVLSFAIFFVWLVTVLVRKNQAFRILNTLKLRRTELLPLFAFFLVALFYYFFVTTTKKAFQFAVMPVTYFFMIVMDAYYFRRDPRYKLSIFFVIVIVLAIQAMVAIPYTYNSEELVSRMFTSGELEGKQLEEAMKHGVGSTNMYSNLCGIFFLGIGMLKRIEMKGLRTFMGFCLTLILASIVSSSFNVVLGMLAIGALIFVFRSRLSAIKFKYVLAVTGVLVCLLLFYNSFLAKSQLIEPIERKIQLIKTGNLREDGRMDLAANSMNTFLNNPFFGVGVPEWGDEKTIGSHLPWIDFPAQYGFLGFLPFLLFLFTLFKKNYTFYLRSPKKNIYATTCLIGTSIFILTNFVDPVIFETATIIMLIFFYTSMDNWAPAVLAKHAVHEENSLHQ